MPGPYAHICMHANEGRERREDTCGEYMAEGNGATARYCIYARAEVRIESQWFDRNEGMTPRTYQGFFGHRTPVQPPYSAPSVQNDTRGFRKVFG